MQTETELLHMIYVVSACDRQDISVPPGFVLTCQRQINHYVSFTMVRVVIVCPGVKVVIHLSFWAGWILPLAVFITGRAFASIAHFFRIDAISMPICLCQYGASPTILAQIL